METTSPARQAPLRFLTPEAKRAEVDAFWSAHPDALFPQRTLEAVTDYSPAYFERARWAGTGPKFIKLGRRSAIENRTRLTG